MSAKLDMDSSFHPNAQCFNYVDNWLFLSHLQSSVVRSIKVVHDLAPKGSLDVQYLGVCPCRL